MVRLIGGWNQSGFIPRHKRGITKTAFPRKHFACSPEKLQFAIQARLHKNTLTPINLRAGKNLPACV